MDQAVGINENDMIISENHHQFRLQPIISKIIIDDTFATKEDEHDFEQFNQNFNIFSKFQNPSDQLIEIKKDTN